MPANKISIVSGGFDPLHVGHIELFNSARSLSDALFVILNTDRFLFEKKARVFMPFNERKAIIENLRMIDEVISFEDDKNGSCINALQYLKKEYPNDKIIFCNGGDRTNKNIPEMIVKDIEFKFGVGGNDKKNSSSWLLKNWNYGSENRVWGNFYNLYD